LPIIPLKKCGRNTNMTAIPEPRPKNRKKENTNAAISEIELQ